MHKTADVSLHRLGHDWFLFGFGEKNIFIDPFKISWEASKKKADFIFITHDHSDHLSPEDVAKIIVPETTIIAPTCCKAKLAWFYIQELVLVSPEEEFSFDTFSGKTIPAYNTNKYRAPGVFFHPKEAGYVGYFFQFWATSVYHAGDTDVIPEMKTIHPDIVLLPVSGTYVMDRTEAVQAVDILHPRVAIPMHYDSIVGTLQDAENFAENASCEVVIGEKEE